MANSFRPYCLYQAYLLPQSPREWLPEEHLAFFLEEMVSLLDLRPIFERYEGGRGPKAYHPQMLLTVLLYGYCTGVCSSRKIARSCEMDLAFRVLSGGQFPDCPDPGGLPEGALGGLPRVVPGGAANVP